MEVPKTDPPQDARRAVNRLLDSELASLPAVLTVKEAAALLRVGRNQAYDMVRSGEIPAVRYGSSWRIPRAALVKTLGFDA